MAQLALAVCALLGLWMGFKDARPMAQFAPERPAAYTTNALATGQPLDAKAIDPMASIADEASDEDAAAASDAAVDAVATAPKPKPKPKPKPAVSEGDAATPIPVQPAPPPAQTAPPPEEPAPETPPF